MIDDLDLAFDDREPGRHRRSRRKKKRRSGRGKSIAAFLIAFLLLGTLGGGAWYGYDRIQNFFMTPDYSGTGTGEAMVEVKAGDTATDIGNTLVEADVVKSAKAFIEAAKTNSRSKNIQVGHYKLRKQMSGASALEMLLDPKNRVVNGVTIPEGRTVKQTFELLSKHTKIPIKEFEAAAKNPIALGVPDWWFKRDDGKDSSSSIEGFLFPATYEIPPKATAESILSMMVDQFLTVTGEMKFAERVQNELKITPYEALIVASLAQAEAGHPDDLGKVARVAYNRLFHPNSEVPCQCFEMDVTVNYWLELQGKKTKTSSEMKQSELINSNNPYDRKLKGFIPTPINNPGELALKGAMAPPKGKWYFFVAVDKDGHSEFAETNAQHERNKQKARENGVLK
ncbi:MAG TPA: endolytic transglycosylase MltG [Micromonosporaceae bacterium]|nr:endolytic transglycosylase MltG [Micromonosporaceae bacterium]